MDKITVNTRPLRREEAARYLSENHFPCAHQTLAKLASLRAGPRFRKAGVWPMYDVADLDEWAKGRLGPYRVTSKPDLEAVAA